MLNKFIILLKKVVIKSTAKKWPTKPPEIWIIIQALLFEFKPKTIIEFGSGRSTQYFSEYAQKLDLDFISIEENILYSIRNHIGLVNSFLKNKKIHHVSIQNGWYNLSKLKKITLNKKFELVMIDGPTRIGNGSRNTEHGNIFLKTIINDANIIIIDDTHENDVKESYEAIMRDYKKTYKSFELNYAEKNKITFFLKKE